MVSALIFALALAAFGLLVFGERMGLAPELAALGVLATFLAAFLAIAAASATSRLGRYVTGAERGAGISLAVLVACLLTLAFPLALAFGEAPLRAGLFLGCGLLGAQIISPFNPWRRFRHTAAPDAGGGRALDDTRGAMPVVGLAMALAALVLVVHAFPLAIDRFALAGGWDRDVAFLAALGCFAALLLLGGMVALARVALVLVAIALVVSGIPFVLDRLALFSADFDGAALISAASRLLEAAPEATRAAAAKVDWPAAILGFALGMVAFQPAAAADRRGVRTLALLAGLGLAAGLLVMASVNAALLADLVSGAVRAAPPSRWPVFVFDDTLKGWLTVCGRWPEDAIAAARACGLATPHDVLAEGAIVLRKELAAPALAVAQGWPVILGLISGLVLPLVELAALGLLLLAAAAGLAEGILVRGFHPKALRSWRLAMARLMLIAIMGLLLLFRYRDIRLEGPLFRWLLLGLAMTALAAMIANRLVRLVRRVQHARAGAKLPDQAMAAADVR